jgi:hypothetical protein
MHRRRLEIVGNKYVGCTQTLTHLIIQLVFRVDGGYCQLEEVSASSYPEG